MKFFRWFLEILVGIILFPFFLVLGLIIGLTKVYSIYNKSIEDTLNKK